MNKVIFGTLLISLFLVIEANALVFPTYDATGTWIISETNAWTDCPGDTVQPDIETITINQTGRIFIVRKENEVSTGSINGSTYLMIRSYPQKRPPGKFGTETETVTVTLSSKTKGTGKYQGTWSANDGSVTCSWGSTFDIIKKGIEGASNP
jgi:hypothetical protein